MTNSLMKVGGGLPMSAEDLKAGLQTASQAIQGGDGSLALLRLLKSGTFVYGPENIEIEPGSRWAVNPNSIQHGWVCWGDSELLDERMVPFNQAPPVRAELPDLGYDWNQQVAVGLQCVSGEDEGQVVLYKGSSKGIRNAMKKLIAALVTQLNADPVNYVPIVHMDVDSYNHPKWGETFFPVIDVLDWTSMDGGDEDEDEDDPEVEASEPVEVETPDGPTTVDGKTGEVIEEAPRRRRGAAPAAKPARRRRGAAAPAEEAPPADEEDAPPARRRRRRG